MNVKKLVALGAGAALVGAALAPIATAVDVQKSDLANSQGQIAVDIVVASNAGITDVLWGGNIAALVAQFGVTEQAVTVNKAWAEGVELGEETTETVEPTDLSVDLAIGGTTTTYSDSDSETYDSTTMNSTAGTGAEFIKELTSSQLSFLYNSNDTFKYGSGTTATGTNYTQTIKEKIGIEADARFDYDRVSVEDFIVYMDAVGDFNYELTFTKGIPTDNTLAGGYDTAFQDGDNDNIRIPWFGEMYTVFSAKNSLSANYASSELTLVKDTGKVTYYAGEEITGLTGKGTYAGEELKAVLETVYETSQGATYQARWALYKADDDTSTATPIDTQTAGTAVFLEDQFKSGDVLDTSLYVEAIGLEKTGDQRGFATVTKGDDLIKVVDNKQYPYSASDTDSTNDYWKAEIVEGTTTSPDVNTFSKITIYNNIKLWDQDNPLYAGGAREGRYGTGAWSLTQDDVVANEANHAVFLDGESDSTQGYGYAEVVFDGWKGGENTTLIEIGDGKVHYWDTGDTEHNIPFYDKLKITSTERTFTIDDQTFYYRCDTTDNNFLLGGDNNYLNGQLMGFGGSDTNMYDTTAGYVDLTLKAGETGTTVVDLNGFSYTCTHTFAGSTWNCVADGNCEFAKASFDSAATGDYIGTFTAGARTTYPTWYYDDGNTDHQENLQKASIPLTGSGLNDQTYYYTYIGMESTYGNLWLLLDDTTNFAVQYAKDIQLVGTDTDETTGPGTPNATYYVPDEIELGGSPSDNTFYVASFNINENAGGWDGNVYIETKTDNIVVLPNNNLDIYSVDFNYKNATWTLRYDTPGSYIAQAYSDYGSWYTVADEKVLKAVMPENQQKLKLTVIGEGTTTTTAADETFEGVAEGEKVTTEAGTEITVSAINYTAGTFTYTPAGVSLDDVVATADPDAAVTIVPVGTLLKTDKAAMGSGKTHIIIGGQKRNTMAVGKVLGDGSTIEETLVATGDYVSEKLPDGDFLLAGYTAADTETACGEFVDALEALLG